MLPSHDMCPICNNPLKHIVGINKAAPIINKKELGYYVESTCANRDNTFHIFYQFTSKEGELLVEKIQFPQEGMEIEVNYALNRTMMTFFSKPKWDYVNKKWDHGSAESIELKDRLVALDYPKLEKATKKIKSLAIFL